MLEGLGLTKGEIKIYLTLLELGETKVGLIIEKSSMASSAVHNSINSLIEKGLVSYIKKNKIKNYNAVSPKQLLNFIEEKKKKIREILPELESKQKNSQIHAGAEVFVGIKGIITLLNLFIEDTKENDEFLFFSADVSEKNKEIQEFYERYDLKRKQKKLVVKGIAPKKLKPLFVKRKSLNMRYADMPLPSNTGICNNKIVLFSWGEKPIGYLIRSKQISESYAEFFKVFWKTLST